MGQPSMSFAGDEPESNPSMGVPSIGAPSRSQDASYRNKRTYVQLFHPTVLSASPAVKTGP